METGKKEKAGPRGFPRVPKPGAKPARPERGKKATRPMADLTPDLPRVARMIARVRKQVEAQAGRAAELKAGLGELTGMANTVLLQIQELKSLVESLGENGRGQGPVLEPRDAGAETSSGAPAPAEAGTFSAPAVSRGAKKILIVDDDPTTIKVISHFLHKGDYSVSSTTSGVGGLKKAFKEEPDLILLDIMMPDLNGFQFLSIYQKDEENARTPVVILSSLAEEADVLKALEIGAVDFITKPFSPQVLMAKIKKSLNSRP